MDITNFLENSEEKKKAIGLIHRVYVTQLKNSRSYNAFTKTKSEVRGGGRKPWKQKGTGRARAGSLRSPLFVGGGVSFGPKPRTVIKKVNKKEKRLAIMSALYLKKKNFVYINENDFSQKIKNIKTKNVLDIFNQLGIESTKKILFIVTKPNLSWYKNLWLSTRNLKNIELTTSLSLNLKQLLNTNQIILSEEALSLINRTN
jgi:large subunit ribosomal protein L4